jgi:hypothetical protein
MDTAINSVILFGSYGCDMYFNLVHTMPIGQLHLVNVKIIFILGNTSSFQWVPN